MNLSCLIVEDEPLAQELLVRYADSMPNLEVSAICSDAFQAIEFLQKENVDLLLLDINMPRLSGINLVKSLSNPPLVIFITAYPEFAIEGFELEAVDYLLKPFSFERFVKAINKASKRFENNENTNSESNKDFLAIKADKKLHKIGFSDILYFTAIGDYVKVFIGDKVLITNETLKVIERKLPATQFVRIHKSHIISIDAIEFIEGNRVKLKSNFLPIGTTYKEQLLKVLRE